MSYISLPRPSPAAKQAARAHLLYHWWCRLLPLLALAGTLWLPVACRGKQEKARGSPSAQESAERLPQLPPLRSASDVLEIRARGDAGVSVPLSLVVPAGAQRPKPIILVQQAIDPDPSRLCRDIQALTLRGAFVLCQALAVRGQSGTQLLDPSEAERQLRHGLREVKRLFAPYIAPGSALLIAVNDSSRHAAFMVRKEPQFFARVLQVSADLDGWTAGAATLFARGGGQRVVFGCAKPEILDAAAHRAILVKRSGADARAVAYEGGMKRAELMRFLREHWTWLVQGDERFAAHEEND